MISFLKVRLVDLNIDLHIFSAELKTIKKLTRISKHQDQVQQKIDDIKDDLKLLKIAHNNIARAEKTMDPMEAQILLDNVHTILHNIHRPCL